MYRMLFTICMILYNAKSIGSHHGPGEISSQKARLWVDQGFGDAFEESWPNHDSSSVMTVTHVVIFAVSWARLS